MNWRYIMLHHSAVPDRDHLDIESYEHHHVEIRGWRDIGYHWVVERVNGVYVAIMGRPMTMIGSHCPGMNSKAIGVCLAGNLEDHHPPQPLLLEGAQLVAGLIALKPAITVGEIVMHKDYRNTDCPGSHFPLMNFREMVREQLLIS